MWMSFNCLINLCRFVIDYWEIFLSIISVRCTAMYVHVKCMEIEFTISYHVYFAISLNWNHTALKLIGIKQVMFWVRKCRCCQNRKTSKQRNTSQVEPTPIVPCFRFCSTTHLMQIVPVYEQKLGLKLIILWFKNKKKFTLYDWTWQLVSINLLKHFYSVMSRQGRNKRWRCL